MPEASPQQVFHPLFQGEPSRSQDTSGGLGPAIVKPCVEACQVTVGAGNQGPRELEVQIVVDAHAPSAG